MQKDGSHDASPPGLPESPLNLSASSSIFQPSEKMKYRLEKLAEWRIDQSAIEFPKEPCEIRGGNATVSRAVLVSPSDNGDSIKQHGNTGVEGVDSDGTDGQTSRPRKNVAVKKMKMSGGIAQVLGLTVREAEFLVGLSHENVIKLEGFVEDLSKDIVWLVFPWEENGTLRDFIASADWEIPERIWLIADVASGVEYLHSQRPPICHGDLKSPNILVNSKCFAVITDFGSARHLKIEELRKGTKPAQNKPQTALSLDATFCTSTNTITLTGDHYTLRWAAPELLYEEEPSLCSDIWAFGWVAYEVMTNSIPFQNVKDAIVIMRVIQGDLPSITGDSRMSLIQALCSLMIMCWSIDPSKRPTAEDCRKSINWMPMIAPNPIRTFDTAASRARSPELLTRLGAMYWHQGDYSNALDLFTKALGGYTDDGNRKGKVTALLELGQVHRLRNECGQAIPFYSEALQICTDIGDRVGRADALWGLAEVHRFQEEYGQAITFYSEALQFSTDIGDRMRRACALKGLADVHRARNEYNQAIPFYSEALQICAETRDRQGSAQVLRGLAQVHRLQNQYSQATTLFSEALQISSDMGNQSGRAQALLGLADVRRDQDDHIDAIRLYNEAAEVFEQTGDTYNTAYASDQAAKVRRLLHREDVA